MSLEKGHSHVDSSGLVYLPYLHFWQAKSHNLVELCAHMSGVFGAKPPVRPGKAILVVVLLWLFLWCYLCCYWWCCLCWYYRLDVVFLCYCRYYFNSVIVSAVLSVCGGVFVCSVSCFVVDSVHFVIVGVITVVVVIVIVFAAAAVFISNLNLTYSRRIVYILWCTYWFNFLQRCRFPRNGTA